MSSLSVRDAYIVTIGIECHVQLKTASKLFSNANNDAREAPPNTLINHIDLGFPGALPVLNKQAVELGMRAAFALGTAPQKFSKFDRKHYFYPDLPLGYQITQFENPIIKNGEVIIEVDGSDLRIGITEAHLEADAGKSTHPAGKDYSLVDFNRAGTPLLEIVSAPDIHSPAAAKAYAKELYLRMRFAGVSDANLFYGNMRFDVNVSVSKDKATLGKRTETKNLNSFRSVEKAAEFEINRQIELLENGQSIEQETRGWDDVKQVTFSQRSKEDAHDYRYMPDPDIPPIVLTEEEIDKVAASMPRMPQEWRNILHKLEVDPLHTEMLLEAEVDEDSVSYLSILESIADDKFMARTVANWMVNTEIPLRRNQKISQPFTNAERLELYRSAATLLENKKLSSTSAKSLISNLFSDGAKPKNIEKYAEEQGYIQTSNVAEIESIVRTVLAQNPQAVNDVKNGELKAIGFLVGQVMKESKGKANPGLSQELIKQIIGV